MDITVIGHAETCSTSKTGIYRVALDLLLQLHADPEIRLRVTSSHGPENLYRAKDHLRKLLDIDLTGLTSPLSPRKLNRFRFFDWTKKKRATFARQRRFFMERRIRDLGNIAKVVYPVPKRVPVVSSSEEDVYLSPFHPLPASWKGPRVLLVHDVIPKLFPEWCTAFNISEFDKILLSLRQDDAVITVSRSTKEDFLKVSKASNPEKVKVAWPVSAGLPVADVPRLPESPVLQDLEGTSFFFVIGTLEPRKNLATLLEAYSSFSENRTEFKRPLIVVGARLEEHADILEGLGKESRGNDLIRDAGFLADADLAWLYAHASACILPSLYEGFGLPLLECLRYGCPVLCSDIPSYREIIGNSAIFFNPLDAASISEALQCFLDTPTAWRKPTAAKFPSMDSMDFYKEVKGVLRDAAH
jgi:glycosyltransferase involved in cell wall biosynthesis